MAQHPIDRNPEPELRESDNAVYVFSILLILMLVFGGAFFLYSGLKGMDNSLTVAAGAAMGSALFVGAIILITVLGFESLKRRQDEQTRLLKQQNVYLRYLAEAARENRKVEQNK